MNRADLRGIEGADSCVACVELEALIQTRHSLGAAADIHASDHLFERPRYPNGLDDLSDEELAAKRAEYRCDLLLSAWLDRDIPLRDYLLGGVMCSTSRWLIFGETGVGKTLFTMSMVGGIASARGFLKWMGQRRARVMYLDGELPVETFKERMQLVASLYGRDLQLFGYNRDDLIDSAMPPLNTGRFGFAARSRSSSRISSFLTALCACSADLPWMRKHGRR